MTTRAGGGMWGGRDSDCFNGTCYRSELSDALTCANFVLTSCDIPILEQVVRYDTYIRLSIQSKDYVIWFFTELDLI